MAAMTVLLLLWIAGGTSAAIGADAAFVEHTFVVSQMNLTHLGKETLVTVVNEQLPGPTIEVTEGDSLAVHVVNKSPYGITIHWHGVKQRLNCWADGVGMITQCPIQPNTNFTYRFDVTGQEGTLWWHAHVACLRGTVHGALLIRPRLRAGYPFPKPDRDIPIIIGEWWETDLAQLDKSLMNGSFNDYPKSATINGKLGDLYNYSGGVEDNYIMNLEYGKKYLLRIVNAALFSEYYIKIAGHNFTVVAADANYVKPYTTDIITIAPGETMDALLIADAPPGMYYMVVMSSQPPKPDTQIPMFISRGIAQYNRRNGEAPCSSPMIPKMPDQHDILTAFHFRGNLTSLPHPRFLQLPDKVDEHMFIVLGLGTICRPGSSRSSSSACNNIDSKDSILVATMNNISFHLPAASLLEAHYYNDISRVDTLRKLPDQPPRMYNFTDENLIPVGGKEVELVSTSKGTSVRRFRYNTSVEIVFQSTALLQTDSNPMHLHGHDFFVLAQGHGNYDAERDVKRYNLVDPPVRNTVQVPNMGWAAIRFVTNNPGMWYMHCHYEFHVSMGMGVVFEVGNGPTLDTTLPPPPADFPRCDKHSSRVAYQ